MEFQRTHWLLIICQELVEEMKKSMKLGEKVMLRGAVKNNSMVAVKHLQVLVFICK